MRLRTKEIAEYRKRQLKKQKGMCPMCGRLIEIGDDTLDHSHQTGHVRMVLHRNCNQLEGRVMHYARRSGIPPIQFLENLLLYLNNDFTNNPLHPNHKFEHEKQILSLKRRMRRLKTGRRKQWYMDKIRELQRESDNG